MNDNLSWNQCAVIGAGGKMGRGIALILLQQMACNEALQSGRIAEGSFNLTLIDSCKEGLVSLKSYLRTHLLRYAEKKINDLRRYFANNSSLVSNKETIDYFVLSAIDNVYFSTGIEEVRDIPLIFEAVIEDVEAKSALYKKIDSLSKNKPYYLTNTSSIPIAALNTQADLDGRIIGFHLYNPPPVQKLLEIIPLEKGNPALYNLAVEIGRQLGKSIIVAKDVAGFIGNGHFIREITAASHMVDDLAKTYPLSQAIYMINRVTGDFLLRPMGIFQLIDYVGLDVVEKVGGIMNLHLNKQVYSSSLLTPLLTSGHKGGQHTNGSQKEGFFCYHNHAITGIYLHEKHAYEELANSPCKRNGDEVLGPVPDGNLGWAQLCKDPDSHRQIEQYLRLLTHGETFGCKLATTFLRTSKQIIDELVADRVAASSKDVETVLKQGFYHLYASI